MNCQICRNEIEELELSSRLGERSTMHLASCPACRAFHDERHSLRRLVGSLSPVSSPPDFDFRLRARLAAAGKAKKMRFSWHTFTGNAQAISLATAFALLAAGIVFYKQFRSGTTRMDQSGQVALQESGAKAQTESRESVTPAPASTVTAPREERQNEPSIMTAASQSSRRTMNNRNSRRQLKRLEAGASQDIALKPAPQIKLAVDEEPAETVGQISLPVRSSAQPVRVLLKDGSGGKRTVSLQPVIFGSQDLTGQSEARLPTSQGIW